MTRLVRVTESLFTDLAKRSGERLTLDWGDPVEWVQPLRWEEADNPDNPPVRRDNGLPEPVYEPTLTTHYVDEIEAMERGETWL